MVSTCAEYFPLTMEELNAPSTPNEMVFLIDQVDTLMSQALENGELAVAGELAGIQESLLNALMSEST